MPSQPEPIHKALDTLGLHFGQLGVIVDDLDAAVAAHAPLGPWAIYTYDRSLVPGMHVAREPADFSFRLALNPHKPQTELIEPLDDGSPYATWLADHGPGLHHLGFYVDDVEAASEAIERAGFPAIMGGTGFGADGTGGYCYHDTVASLGYIVELIEVPLKRHPPEAIVAVP